MSRRVGSARRKMCDGPGQETLRGRWYDLKAGAATRFDLMELLGATGRYVMYFGLENCTTITRET